MTQFMADQNLLATLEQSLRQTRATRIKLASRLSELEAEIEKVRNELNEVDAIALQTEQAIYRLLSSVLGNSQNHVAPSSYVSDAALEAAIRQDEMRSNVHPYSGNTHRPNPAPPPVAPVVHAPPSPTRNEPETSNDRFYDRTIPQATTMILREAGGPLHVNEIYNRLLEGGFNFTGHNPTISIAVSLNRNSRFRKVAPGTFDLVMRDIAQAK
jgi:hypothetical protein